MKFIVLVILSCFVSSLFAQQWQGTNPIYFIAGNVGIGTATPYDMLNIAKTGNNQLVLQDLSTAAADVGGGIRFLGYTNGTAGANYFATLQGVKAPNSAGGIFKILTSDNVGNSFERLRIDNAGNVGIGTTSPDAKLAVSGQVHAQEVKVSVTVPGPDYVFEKDYKLTSLEEIKNYIDQNKHLPEVPSAKEMEKNGVQLGEMNMLLLRKIEELTLHLIEQNNIIAELKERSVSPDPSGKKIEELTLYLIEQNKKIENQQKEIGELKTFLRK